MRRAMTSWQPRATSAVLILRLAGRDSSDAGTWRAIFARRAASGLLTSQVCRQDGLRPGIFRRWRTKLATCWKPKSRVRGSPNSAARPKPPVPQSIERDVILLLGDRLEAAPALALRVPRQEYLH